MKNLTWEDLGCKILCPYLSSGMQCTTDVKNECKYRKLFARMNSTDFREKAARLLSDDAHIAALREKGYSGELRKVSISII